MAVDSVVILFAAVKSVLAAGMLFAWAAGLAWADMVDQKFLGKLSKTTKYMFMPSLIFNAIASGMSVPFLKENYVLIVFGVVFIMTGFVYGHFAAKCVRMPDTLRPWFAIAIATPNMIALPLILVEAICREQEETQGAIAQCYDGATTRLFTVTLTHTFIIWIFFYNYVNVSGSDGKEETPLQDLESDKLPSNVSPGESNEVPGDEYCDLKTPTSPDAIPETIGHVSVPTSVPTSEERAASEEAATTKISCLQQVKNSVLEPPVMAMIVALAVACVPQLHGLLYRPGRSADQDFKTDGHLLAISGSTGYGWPLLVPPYHSWPAVLQLLAKPVLASRTW